MKRSALLLALAFFALLTGCSTVQVETDYDRSVDFTQYKTYRWIPHVKGTEDNPLMNDQLIRSHVVNSVNAYMAQKGYVKIEDGTPDFLLAYFFTARNRVDVTHHYGYYYPSTSVHKYKEGTLILDVVDASEKQLIWRGWATDVLQDRNQIASQIDYTVGKLLKKFPPGSKPMEKPGW
jgi:hypothetical protein